MFSDPPVLSSELRRAFTNVLRVDRRLTGSWNARGAGLSSVSSVGNLGCSTLYEAIYGFRFGLRDGKQFWLTTNSMYRSIWRRRSTSCYFTPQHQKSEARTMWSLSNAVPSAFKEPDPIPQFRATARLGRSLEAANLSFRIRCPGFLGKSSAARSHLYSACEASGPYEMSVVHCFEVELGPSEEGVARDASVAKTESISFEACVAA